MNSVIITIMNYIFNYFRIIGRRTYIYCIAMIITMIPPEDIAPTSAATGMKGIPAIVDHTVFNYIVIRAAGHINTDTPAFVHLTISNNVIFIGMIQYESPALITGRNHKSIYCYITSAFKVPLSCFWSCCIRWMGFISDT